MIGSEARSILSGTKQFERRCECVSIIATGARHPWGKPMYFSKSLLCVKSPGIWLTLLFHRLSDLETDQPRNKDRHIQLAEHRLHYRQAARALGDRRDISKPRRRQAHKAVVGEVVKRGEQRRAAPRALLEKRDAERTRIPQFDECERIGPCDANQQVRANRGAYNVEANALYGEQPGYQRNDRHGQEQTRTDRAGHLERLVRRELQHESASERRHYQY